jgi:CheY-like chemotaxis protein
MCVNTRLAPSAAGVSILVVEDAPDILDVFTTLLRLEGADAVGAAHGVDALAFFRRRRFDVAVVDLGLPDIPGEALRDPRVGSGRERDLQQAVRLGPRAPLSQCAQDRRGGLRLPERAERESSATAGSRSTALPPLVAVSSIDQVRASIRSRFETRWNMNGLASFVSSLRQRAVTLFHRNDQIKADSAERRERWNQTISEFRKPLEPRKGSEKTNLPES